MDRSKQQQNYRLSKSSSASLFCEKFWKTFGKGKKTEKNKRTNERRRRRNATTLTDDPRAERARRMK